jgi:hypothetical protein
MMSVGGGQDKWVKSCTFDIIEKRVKQWLIDVKILWLHLHGAFFFILFCPEVNGSRFWSTIRTFSISINVNREEIWSTRRVTRTESFMDKIYLPKSGNHYSSNKNIRYRYYVSEHYPSSCLYLKTTSCLCFKTQRFGDWILPPSSCKTYSAGPNW